MTTSFCQRCWFYASVFGWVGLGGLGSARAAAQETAVPGEKQAGLQRQSESRLMQLGTALRMYAQDWDMVLPPLEDAQIAKNALYPYVRKVDAVFLDPQTNTPYQPNSALSRHQIYGPVRLQGPGPQQSQVWRVRRGQHPNWMKVDGYIPVSQEKLTVAFYEPDAAPDGSRAVLFLDGRAARVTAAEWHRLMRGARAPGAVP